MPSPLRPGRGENTPPARRVRGQHGVSACVASALAPRACPRPPARPPEPPVPGTSLRARPLLAQRALPPAPARPACCVARSLPPRAGAAWQCWHSLAVAACRRLPRAPAAFARARRAQAALQRTRLRSAGRAPAAARGGCSADGWAPAALGRAGAVEGRATASDIEGVQIRLSSLLLANKPSSRQIARETLEDELWPWRALLAASASRCRSWRSAASARGSR